MVWGGNSDYQLGNGKRSSLAVPQHLPALVPREIQKIEERRESSMSSGTVGGPHLYSLMTKGRLMKAVDANATFEITVA